VPLCSSVLQITNGFKVYYAPTTALADTCSILQKNSLAPMSGLKPIACQSKYGLSQHKGGKAKGWVVEMHIMSNCVMNRGNAAVTADRNMVPPVESNALDPVYLWFSFWTGTGVNQSPGRGQAIKILQWQSITRSAVCKY